MTTTKLLFELTVEDLQNIIHDSVCAANNNIQQPYLDNKDLVDVGTAAKEISVCPQTVRNLYSKNQIKRYKVGRRILVDLNELKCKIIKSSEGER